MAKARVRNGRSIKNTRRNDKIKPMKLAALVVSAIQDLRETKGITPNKITGYISYASNLPETRVKRQVRTALNRGVEYGILRRYRGHYFLPSRDEMERANRMAMRFAKLPISASLRNLDQAKSEDYHRPCTPATTISSLSFNRDALSADSDMD